MFFILAERVYLKNILLHLLNFVYNLVCEKGELWMIKIDLITGFLGAGKTTFIINYAKYLVEQGQKIGIIENDFGAVNVDMMLLQDSLGDKCDLEMISGGSDIETHRRRFKTKLIAMGMLGYDRVLIEPSGIFDVDEFFDLLYEEPINDWYEIGSVIAIVDAKLETELSKESNFLLASQIAKAGKVILSRSQDASKTDIDQTIAHLNQALKQVQCNRKIDNDVIIKNWSDFKDQDYQEIVNSGYINEDYQKMHFKQEEAYSSLYFMNIKTTASQLSKQVAKIFKDQNCGNVFRIKGFINDDNWLELNATRHEITINSIRQGQEIIIVIGENLNHDLIEKYLLNKVV